MQSHWKSATTLAIALAVLLSGPGAVGSSARRLYGHVQEPLIRRSRHLGRHDAAARISLAVSLNLRDPDGFADLLKGLYDPDDQRYQRYLSTGEFRARFAPTDAEIADVARALDARGLHVTGVSGNNMLLNVEASAGAVESAFDLELHDYVAPDGRQVFAANKEPLLFGAAAGRIAAISGLSTFGLRRHPHFTKKRADTPRGVGDPHLTPAKLRTAYGTSGLAQTGTGETLALFELDGYRASDINTYAAQFGLTTPPLQNVLVSDGTTVPTGAAGADTSEVTLDIELAMAMAPGLAKIMVYEAPNTYPGVVNLYNRIAQDNLAKEVSVSWGLAEDLLPAADRNAENLAFQQMAAQGQSVFVAAGDSGAYDDISSRPTTLVVDDPASQPFVTAVGGTKLTSNAVTGAYTSETSWSDLTTSPHSGGGGGISRVWTLPSWQAGLATSANKGSSSNRMVPDVALDSDPRTGYDIFVTEPGQAGAWFFFGGTSCAAPIWAAYAAIVNQGRVGNGVARLGFANPSLYAIGGSMASSSAFHDIADSSDNLFYPAVTGYDLSTGWGTIKGAGLYAILSTGTLPPSAPGSFTPASTVANLTLTWAASTGATSYNLYKSPTGVTGTFVLLNSGAALTYADATAGAMSYYFVTAVNAVGESGPSSVARGFINESPPGAPTGLAYSLSVIK